MKPKGRRAAADRASITVRFDASNKKLALMEKRQIRRAAKLAGIPMNTFCSRALKAVAERTIRLHS
jgi:hypothetical protein